MSTKQNPEFVSLDTSQWRRNIHAFADTTRQALDAIADELSNHCAGSSPIRSQATEQQGPPELDDAVSSPSFDLPPVQQKPAARPQRKETSRPKDTNTSTDDRLSDLKHKLAQRLAKK